MIEDKVKIVGRFTHIIFQADDMRFSVCKFKLNDLSEKSIIVTGYIPKTDKNLTYSLYGEYVEHPKYGMQFKVYKTEQVLNEDADSIIKYLAGPVFPKVGKKKAKLIVDTLGKDTIAKLKDDIDLLDDIVGITKVQKQSIQNGLASENNSFEKTAEFFQSMGLGMRNIMKIDVIYGSEAISKLSDNPYRMVYEVDGIGFKTADALALKLGFDLNNPIRIEALLVSLVSDLSFSSGDTYVDIDNLKLQFERNTDFDPNIDFDMYLNNCVKNKTLFLEENRVYHYTQYKAEVGISKYLNDFPFEQFDPYDESLYEPSITTLQHDIGIKYDDIQLDAIKSFFDEKMMILTGGPGTGKTTVVKGMIQMAKKLYPDCLISVCAPTGRAAKRLTELTNYPAQTIHSTLLWDLETNTFGKNEKEPLLTDILIIDEFSMVDNVLFYNLLKACTRIKKICLIGDEDQLPSVAQGALLKDLIDADVYKLIRLETIYRQKDGSDVITLAHQITQGYTDFTDLVNDVKFIDCDQYMVKDTVIEVVQKALDKGYEINDIQVMAPMYNGVCGIDRLNNSLQETLNPTSRDLREIKVGYRVFRENDKILQLKNMPDDDVYNGDIGTIIEILFANESDTHHEEIVIDFDGVIVNYGPENFDKITHAYCISVHKAQGSEYPIVVMPIVKQFKIMLQRRLLYTGVTRAKKSLILIGDKESFNYGIKNYSTKLRNTTLTDRIKQLNK